MTPEALDAEHALINPPDARSRLLGGRCSVQTVRFEDTPGWQFTVDEVSGGVFQVLGVDESGRSVRVSGQDPDELLQRCHEQAVQMMSR